MRITRDNLHRLVDDLPEDKLGDADRLLRQLANCHDPFLLALEDAPTDDEPTTPEEDVGAAEAWRQYLGGEGMSPEEAKRALLG
jgi:hypothetical protein